jgi:hypothetical protein
MPVATQRLKWADAGLRLLHRAVANHAKSRYYGANATSAGSCRDRRLAQNQSGKRKVVVIIRERGGNSVPAVFASESAAGSFIRARIAKGTTVHADEASAWDNLHDRFEMKRIDHSQAYSFDGACTNQAEEYFSRLRRAEIRVAALAMKRGKSVDFTGYWQRHVAD